MILSLFALAPSFPLVSLLNPGPRRPPFFASSPCSSAHADCVSLVLVLLPRSFSFARYTHHPSVHLPPTPPCSFPLLFGLYIPACTTLTPCLHRALRHLQRHLFLHHHQYLSTRIATLRTKARLKPKRSTMTTTRGLPSSTTVPISVLSRQLRCSRPPGPHCGESAQLFCG
jgi:hypothetical protein